MEGRQQRHWWSYPRPPPGMERLSCLVWFGSLWASLPQILLPCRSALEPICRPAITSSALFCCIASRDLLLQCCRLAFHPRFLPARFSGISLWPSCCGNFCLQVCWEGAREETHTACCYSFYMITSFQQHTTWAREGDTSFHQLHARSSGATL